MKLFVWKTSATTGYFRGTVAAVANTVEEAREKISTDVDRWLSFGEDEGSPCWYHYDQATGELSPPWDEDDLKERRTKRAELLEDIAGAPVALRDAGVFWQGGGD